MINLFLIIIVIGSPLLFFSSLITPYHCFILEKTTFIQIFLTASLTAYLVKSLQKGIFVLKNTQANYFLIGFLGVAVLSLVQGVNMSEKIRLLVNLCLLSSLFFMVSNNIAIKGYTFFFVSSIAVATIASLYAIFQFFGYDVLILGNTIPCGPLGNTNFLGEYIVCVLPLYVFLFYAHKRYSVFLIASLMVNLWALVLSHSRGAWLAMLISVLVMIGGAYRYVDIKKAGIVGAVLGGIVLLLDIIFLNSSIFKNIYSLVNPDYLSNSFRVKVWQSVWQMILDHPLLGVGIGNFKVMYPLYRNVAEQGISGDLVSVVRVHNDFLQIFVELGMFGFLCFIGIVGKVLKMSISTLTKGIEDKMGIMLTVSLLGGFIVLLTLGLYSFPLQNPVTAFYFWFFAGALIACNKSVAVLKVKIIKINKSVAVSLGILFAVIFNMWIVKPVLASYWGQKGNEYFLQNRLNASLNAFDRSLNYYSGDKMTFMYKARTLRKMGEVEAAEKNYHKALSLAPYHEPIYTLLGALFYEQQAYDKSIDYLSKALTLNPIRSEIYGRLGFAHLMKKHYLSAESLFKKGKQVNPKDEFVLFGLADLWERKGEFLLSINEYNEIIKLNPNRSDIYNNLGILYARLENYSQARAMWEKALAINPDDMTVKQNLKKMNEQKK